MATDDSTPTTSGASDETKRKFREALERKKNGGQQREGHMDGGSAVNGVQQRAGAKREFRRKSS
jgi:membrane-associated protein